MVLVVDASVAVKWFVRETGSQAALAVLEKWFSQPASFAVPELFFFEIMHAFNRLVPMPSARQRELLFIVVASPVTRLLMDRDLAEGVLKFQGLGLSGYDAAYLAAAERVNGRWLTADKDAYTKVNKLGISGLLSFN